jgi:hypothetical protein
LHGVAVTGGEEGIVREAKEKRSFLRDLVYRVLDWRGIFHVGQWIEV